MDTLQHDAAVAHPTIYLKDYQPPAFTIDTVDLDIVLQSDHAAVRGTLKVRRQGAGELVLQGRDLTLQAVAVDGRMLKAGEYQLDAETLTIPQVPDQSIITTWVTMTPQTNTQLEGLYQAGEDGKLFVTQNEPEGFRKITYFIDRPDVLSVYTTRLEAPNTFPTLLANGNLVEQGSLGHDRHYAIWHDPTRKPSYLFACVFGDLAVLKDQFTTMEGRNVSLEIYTEAKDVAKCHVAMQALKDSMRWDEVHYGRAYDLDNYLIVAVSQFNMGAMENKGLNIFNTACVLSTPETTTDPSNFYVKSTIAHEYFHNWTGNRITCRDWFQLCLKEGFTVYRDQGFSNTLQSAAVQRIDDVASLKAGQFAEDAGPMSHPPRPDHFVEINNFYTATVYDKGAEIIRMIATVLGPERFRLGTDQYFADHDGQAVTVEDLLESLSRGSGVDVRRFIDWYSQPGTPCVKGTGEYDAEAHTYTLILQQHTPQKPNYPAPKPLPIPINVALFDASNGHMLPLIQQGQVSGQEVLLMLDQAEQTFTFEQVTTAPIVSLLRDFSAPVLLDFAYSDAELAFLLKHENNGFNQWQAAQELVGRVLLSAHPAQTYLDAVSQAFLHTAPTDPLLASRLLDIPSENYLASRIDQDYDPAAMMEKRNALVTALARQLAPDLPALYASLPQVAYVDSAEAMGQRALRNVVLNLAAHAGIDAAFDWAVTQYQQAVCMTERLGALRVLVYHGAPQAETLLQDFYTRFQYEPLALDLWFGVQASSPQGNADQLKRLIAHTDFDLTTPNRIRSVTGQFSLNPANFWQPDVLQTYAGLVKTLDERNPVLGSRILQQMSRWYTLKAPLREQAQAVLVSLQGQVKSTSVTEALSKMLANTRAA